MTAQIKFVDDGETKRILFADDSGNKICFNPDCCCDECGCSDGPPSSIELTFANFSGTCFTLTCSDLNDTLNKAYNDTPGSCSSAYTSFASVSCGNIITYFLCGWTIEDHKIKVTYGPAYFEYEFTPPFNCKTFTSLNIPFVSFYKINCSPFGYLDCCIGSTPTCTATASA